MNGDIHVTSTTSTSFEVMALAYYISWCNSLNIVRKRKPREHVKSNAAPPLSSASACQGLDHWAHLGEAKVFFPIQNAKVLHHLYTFILKTLQGHLEFLYIYIYMCKLIVSTPKRRWFCKTKAAVLLSEPHCFQRIGRRPKDRDFCWSCPFKSTKNQAPAATSSTAQTQWWRLSEGLPQKQIYTIHHPSSRKVKIWKILLKKKQLFQISKKKQLVFRMAVYPKHQHGSNASGPPTAESDNLRSHGCHQDPWIQTSCWMLPDP